MWMRLEFKPQDLWVGAYWEHRPGRQITPSIPDWRWRDLHIWLCLLPMLPLHLVFEGGTEEVE